MSFDDSDDSQSDVGNIGDAMKVQESDAFGKFYFNQIQLLRQDGPSLPPDVNLICQDNKILTAHKFLLHFVSQFFQVSIPTSTGLTLSLVTVLFRGEAL